LQRKSPGLALRIGLPFWQDIRCLLGVLARGNDTGRFADRLNPVYTRPIVDAMSAINEQG
jgi:hypothetical protein